MAAFSVLKWQNSLQEGKSLSRYNAASFYPEMAKLTSEGKSLDRHMAASSILKWHSSLQVGILCLTGFLINYYQVID